MTSTQEARITNNIFRMLPPEIVANIKAMKSDRHPPTPSATLMKGICYEVRADGVVWVRGGEGAFRKFQFRDDGRKVYLPWGRAIFPLHSTPPWVMSEWDSALGRVLTDADLELRQMRRDPRTSGTRELHAAWMRVQREQAEASGMF